MARPKPRKRKATTRRTKVRIGFGYDVHQFTEGRKLILGGVTIPNEHGLAGHSDADVLLHAICDALLGAAALGDIGRHFPNTDVRFKDISSLELMNHVRLLLGKKGYSVVNIDATVILERPQIADYISTMQQAIAKSLKTDLSRVSVKATTNEGMGFVGRGEGCAAYAVACIETTS